MPATNPTPAPALTDKQIEALWRYLYITVAGYSERLIDPQELDLLRAAVVARAKREAAEDIAQAIEAVNPVEWALAGQYAGRDAATIARGIGATR